MLEYIGLAICAIILLAIIVPWIVTQAEEMHMHDFTEADEMQPVDAAIDLLEPEHKAEIRQQFQMNLGEEKMADPRLSIKGNTRGASIEKYDTKKFTVEDYDVIVATHREWEFLNGMLSKQHPDYITKKTLTASLNDHFGTNKSQSTFARVWNHVVSREDFAPVPTLV